MNILLFPHRPESSSALVHRLPGPVRVKFAILSSGFMKKIMTNECYYPADTEPPLEFQFISNEMRNRFALDIENNDQILHRKDLII